MGTDATLPLSQCPQLAWYKTIAVVASPAPTCMNTVAQVGEHLVFDCVCLLLKIFIL